MGTTYYPPCVLTKSTHTEFKHDSAVKNKGILDQHTQQ